MTEPSADCLVLKIEEYDIDNRILDMTLFVLYDKKEHKYIIRGKRNSASMESCTYSFSCEFADELFEFITVVICKKNQWTYALYNYDNLPATSDEITYDFLKNHDSKVYELSGYDRQKFKKAELMSYLRMLRNVFNFYN
uniref:Uncharacterized protein n=1 Tax=viral metagenome TaxID=1070528 RepID=A0A6C0ARB6_9ZZZZ